MDDTKSMLRAIINGLSAMKEELLAEIRKVDQKVHHKFAILSKELRTVETNLTRRIDRIGLQVARLEDDTCTQEEIDDLDHRVNKLEQLAASV